MSGTTIDYRLVSKKLVPKMLDFIGHAHHKQGKGIAALLGVSQPTVSRWMSGQLSPDATHMAKILSVFYEACAHVRALFPVPANLHYLCSFAPKYTEDRIKDANQALGESVVAVIASESGSRDAIHIDVHLRAAPLRNGARAHCFVDDLICPKTFVILVSEAMSIREQHIVGFEEAYAHVMNKLIDQTSVVKHPAPFI